MGYINKKNKVGAVAENAAPYLQEGELGIDLNAANGDVGRVYVGTGSQNVALAKKTEIDSLNTLKAPLKSPSLTGVPTGPTAAVGTNTTQLATTAFVKAEIANDSTIVRKTGDETIAGVKTFSSSPVVPTPTLGSQAVNKDYVDSTKVALTGDQTKAGVLTLTDGLKLQNQNVSPFSGFKNYIINGNFNVWQRGTSFSVTTGLSGVHADMWRYANTTGQGTLTLSSSTLTYNGVTYKSCKATVSSELSLSSGVAYTHYTSIEDKNSYMLRGKEFVISFLMEVNYAGNYSFSIRKFNDDASITTSFLKLIPCVVGVNKIEIKVPADSAYISPSSASGRGLIISIGTFTQSDTSTVEGWQSGNHASIASAYKWVTQVGAYINIAKVQLEEGSVATPFENRPYGLELSLCQRYYLKNVELLYTGNVTNGISYSAMLLLPVTMRTTPTATFYTNRRLIGFAQPTVDLLEPGRFSCSAIADVTGSATWDVLYNLSAEL